MKTIATFILLIFTTALSYAQQITKDTAIAFSSDKLKFSYLPNDIFASISVSTNKLTNGQKTIQFYFVTNPGQKSPIIRIDSIIFKTSTDKFLTLNNPVKDTVSFRQNGGLYLTITHTFDKSQLEIAKQDLITTIILIVDTKPISIELLKKSQQKFQELLKSAL